jgi:hypothetical protein
VGTAAGFFAQPVASTAARAIIINTCINIRIDPRFMVLLLYLVDKKRLKTNNEFGHVPKR